ncbi:MAG: hypothetical protein Q9165_003263 [Trypethelium subeluteriae]
MAADESTKPTTYEQLAAIEDDFDDVDTEILRLQYKLSSPLYNRRQEVVSHMNNPERFWPLVFEQVPEEFEKFVQPTDSELLSGALRDFSVTRFELEESAEAGYSKGEPRSLHFRFEFQENNWFEDRVLEKRIWYRHAKDGWAGLVSEPVKIHWKKNKDLTQGLTDDAIALFQARSAAADLMKQDLPEYQALVKKVESWNGANTSFFTWFAWISSRRYVGAEESAQAEKEAAERREKRKQGEQVEDQSSDKVVTDQDAEVHPFGEELALALAEEVWPAATKFFIQAQEAADDEMSEAEFEDEDVDESDEDDEEGGAIDIPSLVKGKHKLDENGDAPRKKQKT